MNRMQYRGGQGMGGETAGGGPLQRARIALSNNQPAVTEEICRRRLEKRPDETSTRLLLAQALLQLQRPKEAVTETQRVLQAQPNSVEALLMLSSALLNSNQMNPPKEALTYAERAVQLQPRAGRTHVQLAEVLMMRKDFNRASEEADEAVRLEPKLAAAHLIKGLALLNLRDYDGAAQSSQAAIRQDKTMAPAYFTLAQSLAELKRTDEALEAVNTAQRINPMLPAAQITQLRAQIYRKQRRYRAAYDEFYQASVSRSGKRTRFTPLVAAVNFFISLFGRNGPYVFAGIVVVLALLILFGISKIPVAGGWLVDVLLVGVVGYVGWNAVKMATGGVSPLQKLADTRTLLLTVGAGVVGVIAVFLIAFLITLLAHGHWFNVVSIGFAAVVALIAAFSVFYLTSSSQL